MIYTAVFKRYLSPGFPGTIIDPVFLFPIVPD